MRTYGAWRADRTLRLGAGLAYYALFTIVPFVAFATALGERLFGNADLEGFISERLAGIEIVDSQTAAAAITDELSRRSMQSSLQVIGLVSLLFASSLVFLALTDAVNVIWHQPVGSGMWNSVRRRLTAFAMVLITVAMLAVEFAVTAVTGAATAVVPGDIDILEGLAYTVTGLTSGVALAAMIALLYRFLSPVRVEWRAAIASGVATACLLVAGSRAIGWYMRTYGGASLSGAFGAVLAVLTFVYYEAQILLAGVQVTKTLTLPDEPSSETPDEPPA